MNASETRIKVCNFVHVLQDDGEGYNDFLEQITFLILLKLVDDRHQMDEFSRLPEPYAWHRLLLPGQVIMMAEDNLDVHYRDTLENLGKEGGMSDGIFSNCQDQSANVQ